ncbi:MAG: M1 family metallopeptidase [Bacteroidetes bacterium]|nr:M1 family metallopeptidase [Bacteroidota bacterium]
MRKLLLFIVPILFLSSCGALGIHLKVYNPKKAGTYPKETKQNKLLAETTKYRTCFDVYHNKITVGIEPSEKFIRGIVTISAKAVVDFDTLQLDLYKNMTVYTVDSEKNPLNYWREEGAIFIKMPQTVKAGTNFSVEIAFDGNPTEAKRPPWDGGFVWKKDKDGNPWIGVACESEGSSLWWPSKDVMNDEADSTDVTIIVPKDLVAVSNGVLKDTSFIEESKAYHWHISYPINNYNVTLYVGNFKLLEDKYESNVSGKTTALNHYVLPYNYEKAKLHFQQVKKHMAFYEKMFGPYPWQRDGFKLVESPYAGMEHQSAIAYGNGYKNDYQELFDYIILHETAHEWWGNSVTAADLSDAWIHEGFASYCEALFVESISGYQAYLDYMYWQRISILNKRPVVRQREIRYFDYHDGDIYSKGSWILHTLRTTIDNDSLFFDILKTFRMENHQKEIYSETFVDLVNKKTGKDFNWFFNQYLYQREAPILEFNWTDDQLFFKWKNTNADFVLPIKILVGGKTIQLFPTTKLQSIKLSNEYPNFYDNSDQMYYGTKKNKKLKM